MRETCLYCEQDGITVRLIGVGPWRCCPIHSKDFIREVTEVPEGYALVKKPVLTKLGIPDRSHVTN